MRPMTDGVTTARSREDQERPAPPSRGDAADHAPRGTPPGPLFWPTHGRLASGLGLALADALAWLLCLAGVLAARSAIWGLLPPFWTIYIAGLGWLLFRWASGLYPPVAISQPEELRRSFRTTFAAAAVHFAMLAAADELSAARLASLLVWPALVPVAYFLRSLTKALLIRRRLFGDPCVLIGTGEKARQAIREMRANSELGLVPVGAFGDAAAFEGRELEGVPVLGPLDAAEGYAHSYPVRRAMLALTPKEAQAERVAQLMARLPGSYPVLQVLAELDSPATLLVRPRPVGPYLSLEMRHGRFSPLQVAIKRAFDLIVAVPVFLLALPLIAAAALLVKAMDPGGPAFFCQVREGLRGEPIRIWKVRTMAVGAERRLAEHLASNPEARFEYERTLKLRHDPRIIPVVGRFLRRSSIDELPQLWSVIKGDMSLVGPRVMLGHEVDRFSEKGRELRRDVPPGLTGFWQVMYRNNSDLRIWEVADSYYVNNWSVWLDGWILLRTVRVVLTGAGAF